MLSFFVAGFYLRRRYVWGLRRGAQGIPAAAVTVLSTNHEDPSGQNYPGGSATRFGMNGLVIECHIWLAASYQEQGAGKFGVALTGLNC